MALNWRIGDIKNFDEVCYDYMTAEEAKKEGTTLDAVLAQHHFMGASWFRPEQSDIEKLAVGVDRIKRLSSLTNALIWTTMSVDLGGITEENHVEFWARVTMSEKLTGPILYHLNEEGDRVHRPITFEEIQAHIGLSTNVCDESWQHWVMSTIDTLRDRILRAQGIPNSRGLPRGAPLHQVMKDTYEQMNTLGEALKRHHLGDNKNENQLHERDYGKVWKARNWLEESAEEWKYIQLYRDEEEE